MSEKESELAQCVRRLATEFFARLDGEKCTGVHELLINTVEKPLLEVVLNHTQGNQTLAAQVLGINRNTLRKKIQQYGLAQD
ncbi:MAG: Fis family transcriptional regulator [Betaproteobacteria bacterium]|nr:Fis family transcriptional regulator [Betaproteobacteria bacterium]MDE2423132.1 Fis family transcriptional regulator [Betaproteobacteria bacterium]